MATYLLFTHWNSDVLVYHCNVSQVMSPEQLVVFLEDHAQMERLESLAEQQKVQQIHAY